MKVEELIIDGFKSYATRTIISNWDPQFNAITGLNGSGKSNILDAICFVLGITSMSTVRATNIQDLIYKRGQAGVTKASVTIVFDNSDPNNRPIGFGDLPKISVTRQIVLGGTSKYLINGHRAPQQNVLQLFQSVQLNINNPNFLIMQGKITKVLNMKPQEILSLIEEAAGTKMFEDRREKAERTMIKKESKLQENRTLLSEEIEPKLEKLKSEKRLFLEFQNILTDLEKNNKIVHAFTYHYMKEKHNSAQTILLERQTRKEELIHLNEKISSEINNLNEDLTTVKKQRSLELDENSEINKLESLETDLSNQLSRLKATERINKQNIDEINKKILDLNENDVNLGKQLQGKSIQFEELKREYEKTKTQLNELKALHKNKADLLSILSTGISADGQTDTGYNAQLMTAQDNHNEIKIKIKTLERKIELMRNELSQNNRNVVQGQKDNELSITRVKDCEDKCKSLKQQMGNYGFDPDLLKKLKQKESELKQKIYQLNNEAEYLKRKVANLEFQYTRPHANFNTDAIKGVVAQLFTLDEQNFDNATALQVCAGGRLYNIVVDDQQTASELLEHGRLRRRVTIIPLNKIAARTLSANTLHMAKQIAPGKVELALNLIGYDDEVSKAMEFIFGSTLICKDSETSKSITFNPKIRTRSITLAGDVYDPEGTLSGGSRNQSNSLLIDIQKYNTVTSEVKQLKNELNEIIFNIKQQEEISQKTKTLQRDLEMSLHRLTIAQKNLQSNPTHQLIKRNEELEIEIGNFASEIDHLKIDEDNMLIEINKIKKDAEEFSNDKGSKLKELKGEVDQISRQITDLQNDHEQKYDSYQNLQLEMEQLSGDSDTIKQSSKELSEENEKLQEKQTDTQTKLTTLENELNKVQLQISEEKKRLLSIDEEMTEINQIIESKTNLKNDYKLELQKIEHDLNENKSTTTNFSSKLKELEDANEWLKDKSQLTYIIEQNSGINLKEYQDRSKQLQQSYQDMKRRVNVNIMSMIESVEKKETALKTMIKTIEKDKIKIQETITKLNEYKRETLIKTWEKVTKDFGNIFADLLPNSSAKLVPIEGKDVTEGLEVKVKLGKIWKESLVELSGGQRSLIALSLILALLEFRPAPMYILDEVDAALDLSHTQNIGHLIKTRFKGSQFIVVSLKEGMFTNANKIFRARFQNGTSVVSLM